MTVTIRPGRGGYRRAKLNRLALVYLLAYKRSNKQRVDQMNRYLASKGVHQDSLALVYKAIKCLDSRYDKLSVILYPDETIKIEGHKMCSLVQLIEDGNLEIAGTHMFSNALKYAKNEIERSQL